MELICWDRAENATNRHYLEASIRRATSIGISKIMPHVGSFDFPLRQYLDVTEKFGIETHLWIKPTFGAENIVKRTLSPENRQRQIEQYGFEIARACLNNTYNLEQGLQGIQRLITLYGDQIKGIHLDYIRNDNALFIKDFPCECEACRMARKKWLGREVLTQADLQNVCIMYKELEFRNHSVTQYLNEVKKLVTQAGLKLSIAARANYLNQYDIEDPPVYGLGPAVYEGQDWLAWAQNDLLDFICTMNYYTDPCVFEQLLNDHLRLLQGASVDFYTGIGIQSSMGSMNPDQLDLLLSRVANKKLVGCCLFHWDAVTIEHQDILRKYGN